jgi:hypothetical protein
VGGELIITPRSASGTNRGNAAAKHCLRDVDIHVLDGSTNTLSPVASGVAIAQFDRLSSGRGT